LCNNDITKYYEIYWNYDLEIAERFLDFQANGMLRIKNKKTIKALDELEKLEREGKVRYRFK